MNFTRDPIIETIITPKEGFKLVIRSSKGGGHEEFVVDSVQVVMLGNHCFYRSLEKPKPFLVPAQDYEVLETRETRMVMKLPGSEKGGIKIGGGREASVKNVVKEDEQELPQEKSTEEAEPQRRKEKKRFRRGRRDRFEKGEEGESDETTPVETAEGAPPPREERQPSMIIPPPSTLISETIARYKDIPGFASAFFEREKETTSVSQEDEIIPPGEEEVVAPVSENREEEDFFL